MNITNGIPFVLHKQNILTFIQSILLIVLITGCGIAPTLPSGPTAFPTPPTSPLYQANWSTGKAGWSAPSPTQSDAAWMAVDGELRSDGRTVYDPTVNGFSTIQAPYHPEDHGIQDYAVEAEILVRSEIPDKAENSFGIGVRRHFDAGQNQDQGYGWRVVANTQNTNYIAIYLQPATIPPGYSGTVCQDSFRAKLR